MTMMILTARVADRATWEAKFKPRGPLFGMATGRSPVHYTCDDDNHIAICIDVDDPEQFMATMGSDEHRAAQSEDGVIEGSIRGFLLDKTLEF